MNTDAPRPYQVVMSEVVKEQFREMFRAAEQEGRWDEVTTAAQGLAGALRWVPEIVGEPAYDLRTLGRVHGGSFGPIQLRFAVSDERRVVYIGRVRFTR